MSINPRYTRLFEPLILKNVTLKNRIVKPAQWLLFAEPDGTIGERIIAYYETVAKGGVGLIVFEESLCEFPLGASDMPHVRVDDDQFIPGLRTLVDAVHQHACPIFMQITHAGPAFLSYDSDLQPVAPSHLDPPAEQAFSPARELSISEIDDLVEKFAQAARRAKEAGFDGVEMHMAHYGLVNAFLSRVQNKRDDEYGCQSIETRARFSVEILQKTREYVGPDYVMGVRMNGKEWGHPLGTSVEEASAFAQAFEAAGADYLQVSAYGYGPFTLCVIPDFVRYPAPAASAQSFADRHSTGYLIPEAAAIKQAVSIPVSGVGRLDHEIGERVLREGKVDFICLGRRLLADPELPNKLAAGKEEEIRPCLGCNYCLHVEYLVQPVQCRMNPFLSHEYEMSIQPAEQKKKVMVVGAGPAGLETARVAAERGHEVHLYDRKDSIGGLLPMAAIVKGMDVDDLTKAIDYYRVQLQKLGIQIHLGEEVSASTVAALKPDTIVVATGGAPVGPELTIEKGAHVVTSEKLKARLSFWLRLLGPKLLHKLTRVYLPVGRKVIVIGGDLAGLETAEFLVKRGRDVTIVETAEEIGQGMLIPWMIRLIPWLEANNVSVYKDVSIVSASRDGLIITMQSGEQKLLAADNIVIVTRYGKNVDLYGTLVNLVPELYLIGDARGGEAEYIAGAIRDGARTGLKL